MRDIQFIDDGNQDHLENGMINFEKMRMVASVVGTFLYYQEKDYCFQPVPEIQQFVMQQLASVSDNEDALFEYSKLCEPAIIPATPPEKKLFKTKSAVEVKTLNFNEFMHQRTIRENVSREM
jgi:hypothetical protein